MRQTRAPNLFRALAEPHPHPGVPVRAKPPLSPSLLRSPRGERGPGAPAAPAWAGKRRGHLGGPIPASPGGGPTSPTLRLGVRVCKVGAGKPPGLRQGPPRWAAVAGPGAAAGREGPTRAGRVGCADPRPAAPARGNGSQRGRGSPRADPDFSARPPVLEPDDPPGRGRCPKGALGSGRPAGGPGAPGLGTALAPGQARPRPAAPDQYDSPPRPSPKGQTKHSKYLIRAREPRRPPRPLRRRLAPLPAPGSSSSVMRPGEAGIDRGLGRGWGWGARHPGGDIAVRPQAPDPGAQPKAPAPTLSQEGLRGARRPPPACGCHLPSQRASAGVGGSLRGCRPEEEGCGGGRDLPAPAQA